MKNIILIIANKSYEDVKDTYPFFYKIKFLNDNVTPFSYIVDMIIKIFHKTNSESQAITFQIHEEGFYDFGPFTKDIAETKLEKIDNINYKQGKNLKAIMLKVLNN